MKLREIARIGEHMTSPHADQETHQPAQQKEWLAGAEQVEQGITVEAGSFCIFLNKLAPHQHVFILTPRAERTKPVGYCILEKQSNGYWMVQDVWLQKRLRGQSIMTNLYRSLVALGYKLQSGKVVSPEAEGVWKKLGAAGRAKVLNKETGEVEEFSLKPIDNTFDSQHVWVAEAQWAPKWDRQPTWSGDPADRQALLDWMAGRFTASSTKIKWPGVFEWYEDGRLKKIRPLP